MRQIVLDTETTGLEPEQGHRIIEVGCVELVNRRPTGNNYHQYLHPDREIDEGAREVHGIDLAFLADKPRFADIAHELSEYLRGAELIIHNAPFDTAFLNAELARLGSEWGPIEAYCTILDTLVLARRLHPGQRNSLDALCKRYGIDNSQRTQHGALLDAEILADVYLTMTGGQVALSLGENDAVPGREAATAVRSVEGARGRLRVVRADTQERSAHERYLEELDRTCGGACAWRSQEEADR